MVLTQEQRRRAAPRIYEWLPIPHPNWEYGLARADLHRLQPLLEIVRRLLQRGLTGPEILWTFFSCGVQPPHQ
jgi:hypothetical protein